MESDTTGRVRGLQGSYRIVTLSPSAAIAVILLREKANREAARLVKLRIAVGDPSEA
jgi:hypothetical protein